MFKLYHIRLYHVLLRGCRLLSNIQSPKKDPIGAWCICQQDDDWIGFHIRVPEELASDNFLQFAIEKFAIEIKWIYLLKWVISHSFLLTFTRWYSISMLLWSMVFLCHGLICRVRNRQTKGIYVTHPCSQTWTYTLWLFKIAMERSTIFNR